MSYYLLFIESCHTHILSQWENTNAAAGWVCAAPLVVDLTSVGTCFETFRQAQSPLDVNGVPGVALKSRFVPITRIFLVK